MSVSHFFKKIKSQKNLKKMSLNRVNYDESLNQQNCCEATAYPFVLLKSPAICANDAVPFNQLQSILSNQIIKLLDNDSLNSLLPVRLFIDSSELDAIDSSSNPVLIERDPNSTILRYIFSPTIVSNSSNTLDGIPISSLIVNDRILINNIFNGITPNVDSGVYVVRFEDDYVFDSNPPIAGTSLILDRFTYCDGESNSFFYKDPYYVFPIREGFENGGKLYTVSEISGTNESTSTSISYAEFNNSSGPFLELDVPSIPSGQPKVIPPAFSKLTISNVGSSANDNEILLLTSEISQIRPFDRFVIETTDNSKPVIIKIQEQFYGQVVNIGGAVGNNLIPFNTFKVVNPPISPDFNNQPNNINRAFTSPNAVNFPSNISNMGSGCTLGKGSSIRIPGGRSIVFVRRGMGHYLILGFKTPLQTPLEELYTISNNVV